MATPQLAKKINKTSTDLKFLNQKQNGLKH